MTPSNFAAAIAVTLLASGIQAAGGAAHAESVGQTQPNSVRYHTTSVDGVDVFYAEAGPKDAPLVLLLHGFPTSSHMFRNLMPALADRYHVIAPDYPGFGESAASDASKFAYTFDHYATVVDDLLDQIGAKHYAIYLFDYGAPVGYRLALKHPERVSGLIVQNGNAYEEGLGEFWAPMKVDWANDTPANRAALSFLVTLKTTQFQYLDGMSDTARIDPANWRHDQPLLDRPGNAEIQLDLFHDYGSNVPLYPKFQAYFRDYQPPTLIVWGRNDKVFPTAGALPYLRDLPHAEMHLLDTGHFALEDQLDVIEPIIHNFLDRKIGGAESEAAATSSQSAAR
jgi:pimeloyl-ACP methyl ester carboxylesterase